MNLCLISRVKDEIVWAGFELCVERLGVDLESFARHAKRSTVQIEDVLLCARRNSSLQELLLAFAKDEITGKKTSAKKPKAQVEDEEEVDDDIVEIDKLDESDREDDEDLVPAKKRKLIKTSRRKSKAAIENSVLLDDFDQDEDFDDW
jgi:hypothetical protein